MSISPDVNPGTVDLNLDASVLPRNRWSIEKLSSLSETLTRHSDVMKNVAFVLAGLAIATIILGLPLKEALNKRKPVINSSQIDTSQIDPALITGDYLPQKQSAAAESENNMPSIFRDGDAVINYLNDYFEQDIAPLLKRDRQLAVGIAQKSTHMKVADPMGIILHDFPDKRPGYSRRMPTKGSDTEAAIKAFYAGQEIPGLHFLFVNEKDPKTGIVLNIWAVQFSDKGGWSFHKQPHPEFFRVGGFEETGWKWYVDFETEDGPISGEEYFFGLNFPKPQTVSISPKTISAAA